MYHHKTSSCLNPYLSSRADVVRALIRIPLDDAIRMLEEKQNEAFDTQKLGTEPGHYQWYRNNFVSWISNLGYHIELTGDEFDLYNLSDKTV